jgi:ABC-type antimicrobial peptide transport system permease subunit
MGRVFLVCRLALRDLRRRRGEAVMLMMAIVAATTTLTLGLVLHGVSSQPYQQTKAATGGPDIVANIYPPTSNETGLVTQPEMVALSALERAPGVIGHSGPYPVTWAVLGAHGLSASAEIEGRDTAQVAVDQPKITDGSWLRDGGVVVERSFAQALGVHTGDSITLNSQSFRVAGIAVTAAFTPYPDICAESCDLSTPQLTNTNPGLIWTTQADAQNLSSFEEPLTYYLNLKMSDPARATALASSLNNDNPTTPSLISWQQISLRDGSLVNNEQQILTAGSWLLGLLAITSLAVLVGGRMADQTRRVGLLKAVGATPGLIAAVLLAQYVLLALIAAAAGLAIGRLVAPLLTKPSRGLLGTAGAPTLTLTNVAEVVAAALAVAVVATVIPAIRAARTSTVRALANATRAPRRRPWITAISARLPVPLLLAVRTAARRPRRIVLSVLSIAVTVSGIVAVVSTHAHLTAQRVGETSVLGNPKTDRENQVMVVITIMLITLAAVNAVFISQATTRDSKHNSALARALGASPQQVSFGLATSQLLPALIGALLGIPGGLALVALVNHGGGTTTPPTTWLLAVVIGTLVVMAGLTAIPSRVAARRPVAEILQSELA